MAYKLRFVQRYRPADRAAFMKLEAQFAAMEKRRADFPHGRRWQTYAGREPTNALIWECEFPTLTAAQQALAQLEADPEHGQLFEQQVPCFLDAYTEIYEELEF
ncbi:hypothetical protein HQ590_00280 [bacterium]|nr:hypothetical protein [bacterium]